MDVIREYVTQLATEKQRVKTLVADAADQLRPLNNDLASETAASDGVVMFSVDTLAYPGQAAAVIAPERKHFSPFGEQHVRGRFVELGATALGDEIVRLSKSPASDRLFVSSRLNPAEQTVWTHPIMIDGAVAATAQVAFNSVRNNGIIGIGNKRIEDIFSLHAATLTDVAQVVSEVPIQQLDLAPPTTPNAYTVRWDIRESTRLATGKQQGRYLAYKQALTDGFRLLTKPFDSVVVDAGDGQNIVIYLPTDAAHAISHDDTAGIRVWGRQHITPLLEQMQTMQQTLALDVYPELQSSIRLSVDLGHVVDQDGKVDGDGFSLTAKEMKQRPSAPITYTDRASFLDQD